MHTDEAYRAQEERVLSAYQEAGDALQALYISALEDGETARARMLCEKKSALARVFDMGAYHEVSCGLELALLEKDADGLVDIARKMLDSADTIGDFCRSPLYAHMDLRAPDEAYVKKLKSELLEGFRDEAAYGFLKDDERWRALVGEEEG